MSDSSHRRDIVIIGGGIIGCTSAYFLTRHPKYDPNLHRITLLEATKIAGAASGKAGGLLGSWAFPECLAELSFDIHAQLAEKHNGAARWGYRRLNCGSLDAKGRQLGLSDATAGKDITEIGALHKRSKPKSKTSGTPSDLDWISTDASAQYDSIGNPDNTAQVHPYQFTTAMAQLAEEKGARVILGEVSRIEDDGTSVQAVEYIDKATSATVKIPANDVLIAAGPWTRTLLPRIPVTAMRAHSVTITPSKPISAYAVFTDIKLPKNFGKTQKSQRSHKSIVTPEIYARPNNEAYACGEGDHLVPLPKTSADVETDDTRCQDIIDYVSSISDELRDGEVTARQACYLPQGGPFIGQTGIKGLLLASGHTCWGIQNSPATGKLVSEFVFDGKAKSSNISSLDPRRAM